MQYKKSSILEDPDKIEQNLKIVMQEKVFSKEEQQALTPQLVVEGLKIVRKIQE